MDFPLSPQEVGALKSRLAAESSDESARRDLVEHYRRTHDNDQAGRYAIAIEGYATNVELRAYAAMLRGLGADDRRIASLSRLPNEPSAIVRAREALDAASAERRMSRSLSSAKPFWWMFCGVVLITLVATYSATAAGDAGARTVAVVLTTVSLGVLAIASGASCIARLRDHRPLGAAMFGTVCVVAAALVAARIVAG